MKNLKLVILFLTCLGFSNLKAQSTDFTMFYNGYCNMATIEVYDASNTLLWSGTPFLGKVCVTGGTPASITIIDGTCNSFNFPINSTWYNVAPPPATQCGCLFFTANYPPNTFGFFAQYVSSGGTCASPSGLLTLTLYPNL